MPGQPHALKRDAASAMIFIWFHPVVAYCMLYATVGITKLYYGIQYSSHEGDHARWMTSISLFVVALCLMIMRMKHKGTLYHFKKRSRIIHNGVRVVLACCHLIAYIPHFHYETFITIQALIVCALNLVEVYAAYTAPSRKMQSSNSKELSAPGEVPILLNFDDSVQVEQYVDFNDRSSLIYDGRATTVSSKRPCSLDSRIGSNDLEANLVD
jgi:hypothetical protein